MKLPQYFQFSQGNLQDFIDCRRRFYLRHVQQLAWPAVESEPFIENERYMQQGAVFHRLVQQYFMGIPPDDLAGLASAPPIDIWWQNFLHYLPQLPGLTSPGAHFYPEFSLTGSIAGFRVVAKYDLIVILPDGQTIIYDWKTSHRRPRREWLAERIQTRLYRYLLLNAGRQFMRESPKPEIITLVYWFTGFPDQPEIIPYHPDDFGRDGREFQQLIQSIEQLVRDDRPEEPGISFPLTTQERTCAFCQYRSLCDRGTQAGTIAVGEESLWGDASGSPVFDLDFEQITEIEF